MRITDLLDKRSVSLTAAPKTKSETLDMAVDLMVKSEKISNREAYRKQVYLREEESTTGIGEGIAIPHGKCDAVKKPGLAAMVIKNGVEFEALDDEPVTLLFLIAAPNTEDNIHLDVLSKLSVMLMDEEFTESLRNASSVDEFMDIIDRADSEKKDIDERLADTGSAEGTQAKILAVTSCPTGIAHTYMAAEGIEKAAKAKNCFVKIETRGSGGAKNVLTDQEIADADCIIVAADAKVPMERFDGKKVIECQVSDGISKADQLIDRAINGDAPVYHAAAGSQTSSAGNKSGGSVGHKIYMQLMNGVSHMLPLVVGGGILIAIAFLIDGLSVDLSALPADQRANFGTITPVAALFKGIGGTAFGFMLPILAGFIAMAIGDRPALMPGIVGGLLAKAGTSVFLAEDAWISSGFFGALIAGFAAGYLMIGLKKLFDKLPKTLEGTKPVLLYPFFGILIMAAFMIFIVNPPVGAFNTWLNNVLSGMGESSKMLLGAVLAGMMSIDFGGPFNKAAYVFGTASIASGQFDIMASVMIGGMVPPIAIALATTFFKNRFTKSEQQTSITNYIMGLSFITEGAIPFAASDPLRIIPPCIVGSAIAGALSMMFGCGSRAPHGGIFVIGIIDNPLMFLIALVVGAVVAMAGIVLLKKPLKAE